MAVIDTLPSVSIDNSSTLKNLSAFWEYMLLGSTSPKAHISFILGAAAEVNDEYSLNTLVKTLSLDTIWTSIKSLPEDVSPEDDIEYAVLLII